MGKMGKKKSLLAYPPPQTGEYGVGTLGGVEYSSSPLSFSAAGKSTTTTFSPLGTDALEKRPEALL
ncbi:predicted protein [Plenodomus lingam JN3]|uniref:Predicted protein n=1 Tax=Leptosphaeria maculans (strain JN3 / isolate v23.1.3 / race Av1-4-5-6-7-8) TaxID=985895 RepID=E5ADV8_LEPMJ|nr:predicted protein [Plenodomus lingam JN3]CBY01397.1 predicted protein [Plenodomus lingam JN3]